MATGAKQALPHDVGPGIAAKHEGQRKCQAGGSNGNGDRGGDERNVVGEGRRDLHRRHTSKVHEYDTQAHGDGADAEGPRSEHALADDVESKSGDDDGDGQRSDCRLQVIRHGDRQTECQHADEVHRPDAGAHGYGAAGEPVDRRPAFSARNMRRQRKRDIGSREGDDE